MDNTELIKKKQDKITGLDKDEDYAVEKFDTLIVSLSSGGLVFSVGFVKDIIKNFKTVDLLWLKICWICFALALVGNIFSQVTGYFSNRYEKRALRTHIKILEDINIEQEKGSVLRRRIKRFEMVSDKFDSSTTLLNAVCLFSFAIAVISLIYFIYSKV